MLKRSRANSFMGLLSAFLAFKKIRLIRNKVLTKIGANKRTHLIKRLVAHPSGIGSHIGDEAGGPFCSNLDPFVKALRNAHSLLSGKAKGSRRILLKFRGNKWWARSPYAFFFDHRFYSSLSILERSFDAQCLLFVM